MKTVHPGVLFKKQHLQPAGITIAQFSKGTKFKRAYWGEILRGKKRVTAPIAIEFEKFGGSHAEDWAMMQARYDVAQARKRKCRR